MGAIVMATIGMFTVLAAIGFGVFKLGAWLWHALF
jgi:hypothetical protein